MAESCKTCGGAEARYRKVKPSYYKRFCKQGFLFINLRFQEVFCFSANCYMLMNQSYFKKKWFCICKKPV